MIQRALTQPYQPNPLLSYVYQRFFDHIQVDEAWVRTVREAASRGSVVYVLRNLSFLDFLALDHLTKRYGLPQIRFANDLGLWILEPMGKGWLEAVLPSRRGTVAEQLAHAIDSGGSAALFLKRPSTMLELAGGRTGHRRAMSDGDALIRALVGIQREREKPILLVPQVFVWTKYPDTRGMGLIDAALGPREWPGKLRTLIQFVGNYRNAVMRAGEPLDLRDYLEATAAEANGGSAASDDSLVRRLVYALLRKLERERRAILGPAKKASDRVREEVVRSPKLQQTIRELAGEGARERFIVTARAHSMLRQLQAQPEPEVIRGFDIVLDHVVNRIYDGIEVDQAGLERVREAAKRGTLVLLPSHKSHVDYLILSYVFHHANLQLPVIAAGENLSFFPLGPIFRRGGAFFIRRSFKGDRLYTAVVDAYIRRLIRDGFAIEFFLEGGRSRTGKLLPPKLGLLNMIVEAALSLPGKEVFFVPVSIGYERLVESGAYVRELSGGEKQKEDAVGLLKTTRVLRGRYGKLNLQFGTPISIDDALASVDLSRTSVVSPAKRRALVTRLAHQVMAEINAVTAVTPGALIALALLTHPRRGMSQGELIEACRRYTAVLRSMNARISKSLVRPSGELREEAIRDAAKLFVEAEIVTAKVPGEGANAVVRKRARIYTGPDVIYSVPDDKRLSLDLSKNIIVHYFVPRALIATALLVPTEASSERSVIDRATLEDRVRSLSRLFKYEFMFRADRSFEENFEQTLSEMTAAGELTLTESGIAYGPGHDDRDGHEWIRTYASILGPFLEGYRIAARGLVALLRGPMTSKELAKRTIVVGERMFLSGEIHHPEAISRPVLENAHRAFVDQGYLLQQEGKLTLSASFATAETIRAIEGRVAYWCPEEPPL